MIYSLSSTNVTKVQIKRQENVGADLYRWNSTNCCSVHWVYWDEYILFKTAGLYTLFIIVFNLLRTCYYFDVLISTTRQDQFNKLYRFRTNHSLINEPSLYIDTSWVLIVSENHRLSRWFKKALAMSRKSKPPML